MPSSTSTKKPKDHQPKRKYGAGWGPNVTDLELPSGEVCEVTRPGIQKLMKEGVLQSMDTLTGIVETETIPKAENRKASDAAAQVMKDPEKYKQMMDMVDKIVLFCVTQPTVLPVIISEEMAADPSTSFTKEDVGRELELSERVKGEIYVDYIDEMDKMFIMNFVVGGSRDLDSFRKATENALGGIPAGEAE